MHRWEFSHGKVGVNAPSWLTFEVHQPYFDGAQSPRTVIQALAAILAARRFEQRAATGLRFGMVMPSSYRHLLTQESRLPAYRVTTPTNLPDELASPAWRMMARAYRERADLDPVDRAGLARWLVAACLHTAVLDVVPADLDPAACQDPVAATTQAARATALSASEGLSDRTRAAYRNLLERPARTTTHVLSLAGWGYQLARHAADASAAPALLDQSWALLKDIEAEISDFEHAILTTRLTLRAVMNLERNEQFADAAAQLAEAWAIAADATPADADDELILLETRRRLIDRRVEIAVRGGDGAAERAAIAEGLVLDPSCIKIHMQAGQQRERGGEHEQALAEYLHAARLGPYGTAFALLRAAACAQEIGQPEFGRVLTERAFRTSPRAAATRGALVTACLDAGDEPLALVTRRAAERDPDRPYAGNWHYQMFAAYFNLGESQSPGLYASLPTLAFEAAREGAEHKLNYQRLMPPAFRQNLIRESGLTQFAVSHPAELPPELRTPAWESLCDWVRDFDQLGTERQHRVASVLFRLGFGKLVLKLVPAVPAGQLRTEAEMRLQHWRDVVRWVTAVGTSVATPTNSFDIARLPDCPTQLRYLIAAFVVVFHARETKSVEEVTYWREMGEESLAQVLESPDYSRFDKMMMESRFYRSVSYVPFLRRDRVQLADDMARAEELARAVPVSSEYEDFLFRENLRACLESRSKESYGFHEDAEGHRLVGEVLKLDPYEPKTHIEVAESLLKQDRAQDAADSFLRTARLGPVSTALGYASAAHTFASVGQPILAEDCYLQALRLDPHAISAARGWATVAGANGMAALAGDYLAGLEAWGAARRAARAA